MNNIRELIQIFIDTYCIKIPDDSDYNDKIKIYYDRIEYEEQAYYIPCHDFNYTVDDDILRAMLLATYGL